jgi:hypothetical protein
VTTPRLVGTLLLAIACGHASMPAARADSALQALLATGVERSIARLAAAGVCEEEPTVRIDLTNALGPLARALHGTGRGARLASLDAALCSAGREALQEQGPWLAAEAQRFEVAHPEEVLAGAPGAATASYRAAIEPELSERFSAGLPAALDAAEVPDALAAVRAAAKSLPLSREVSFDTEAAVRARWTDAFFQVLAEEEARVRAESGEDAPRGDR